MRAGLLLVAVLAATLSLSCWAIDPLEFSSPALQTRYQALIDQLRCPKCQNQDLADSNAMIASDLRHRIHDLLEKGYSDQQVLDYLVDRYGQFILYRPRFNRDTALLWLWPLLGMLGAGAILARILRRRSRAAATVALTDADHQQLQQLLADERGEKR